MRNLFFIILFSLFFLTLSAKDIFIIYNGKGIHQEIAKKLQKSIECLMPQATFSYVETFQELNQLLDRIDNKKSCLVIPGGNTRLLVEGFDSKEEAHHTLENIRRHIKEGMSYLGICCGANWACSDCLPEDYRGSFYFKDKLLSLMPAKARWFSHRPTDQGRWVPISNKNGTSQMTYWNRGCYFDVSDEKNLQIISSYKTCESCLHVGMPCTLKEDYGEGKVVATMIHPECDREMVEETFHLKENLLSEREQCERDQHQKDYLKQLLEYL